MRALGGGGPGMEDSVTAASDFCRVEAELHFPQTDFYSSSPAVFCHYRLKNILKNYFVPEALTNPVTIVLDDTS